MAIARNLVKLSSAFKGPARKPSPPVWEGVEYLRIPPGTYDVCCTKIQGPEWLKNRHRWSLRLECNFLTEEGVVSGFLNLGNDPERQHAPRGSRYFKLWCMVNGGPPRRGQQLDPNDFLGKFFRVQVKDASDIHGNPLPEEMQYSKIVDFIEFLGP
jgi:hypothetical protein